MLRSGERQRADVRSRIHSPVRQAQGPERVEGLVLAATKAARFPRSGPHPSNAKAGSPRTPGRTLKRPPASGCAASCGSVRFCRAEVR